MRDHTKLRAFQLIDDLVMRVYGATRQFPREEMFGLTSQVRRAVVSAASNIVEGSGRQSQSDYVHFLTMAYGSLREAQYQMSIANRLGYLIAKDYEDFASRCDEASRSMNRLICALRKEKRHDTSDAHALQG